MRTRDSQIGPIRKFILKKLTKLQENNINKEDLSRYRFLTRLHYRVYTGVSLKESSKELSVPDTMMFNRAAKRHANMVFDLTSLKSISPRGRDNLQPLVISAFKKNFLLEHEL